MDAAERAKTLDPDLPEAYLALGKIQYRCGWNWVAAERNFEEAIAHDAHDADAIYWAGTVAHALGSVNDALQLYQQADALDPVNWAVQERLADAY